MRKWILSTAALIAVSAPAAGWVWADTQPSQAAENTVVINETEFIPADITVSPGTTITWQNGGKYPHSAKAEDASFDSGYIAPGGQASVAFPNAGDFAYYCEPHPYKKGVVHVR